MDGQCRFVRRVGLNMTLRLRLFNTDDFEVTREHINPHFDPTYATGPIDGSYFMHRRVNKNVANEDTMIAYETAIFNLLDTKSGHGIVDKGLFVKRSVLVGDPII